MYIPQGGSNFRMKPVKVYDLTVMYDICFRKNLQMYTAFLNNSHTVKPFSTAHILSNHFNNSHTLNPSQHLTYCQNISTAHTLSNHLNNSHNVKPPQQLTYYQTISTTPILSSHLNNSHTVKTSQQLT